MKVEFKGNEQGAKAIFQHQINKFFKNFKNESISLHHE